MHARGVLLSYETCIMPIVVLIDLKKSKVGLSLLKLKGNCNKGGSTPLSPHALHYKALIMVSICALIRARFALRGQILYSANRNQLQISNYIFEKIMWVFVRKIKL
jgi:hypothetical protein